jgi:hypothetical protein
LSVFTKEATTEKFTWEGTHPPSAAPKSAEKAVAAFDERKRWSTKSKSTRSNVSAVNVYRRIPWIYLGFLAGEKRPLLFSRLEQNSPTAHFFFFSAGAAAPPPRLSVCGTKTVLTAALALENGGAQSGSKECGHGALLQNARLLSDNCARGWCPRAHTHPLPPLSLPFALAGTLNYACFAYSPRTCNRTPSTQHPRPWRSLTLKRTLRPT